jgi:DNA helicase-2/ATP-dependent DNA helicase PcrA
MNDRDALLAINGAFPSLNQSQKEAIHSVDGPLQIIAGPGSGKTLVLILRAMYLLLTGRAQPDELLITTFTEKAAFELGDRLNEVARLVNYKGRLYEVRMGTIHSICDEIIRKFIAYSPLKKNYDVLDDLSQSLFMNNHFDEIFPDDSKISEKYLGRYEYKWTTIKNVIPYFNKIVEEMIDPDALIGSHDDFTKKLGDAFKRYEDQLFKRNKIDFSHQQKIFFQLLEQPGLHEKIRKNVKYVMIDEYQDTNFVQEQIILKLSSPENNICVVGDEDQSLYRFRGATVRNILEFSQHFEKCKQIVLDLNYRSHKNIIDSYNNFMQSVDWSSADRKTSFRFHKSIKPHPEGFFPDYPATFSIWGTSKRDEAQRLASFIAYLKTNKIIEDYSQVALLLHSVRLEHSGHYLEAFEKEHIPAFAPRARAFFDNDEVRLIFACYVLIFGFYDNIKEFTSPSFSNLVGYVNRSLSTIGPYSETGKELSSYIKNRADDIEKLKSGETLDLSIGDYFYELISFKPFSDLLKNENSARNLAIFSQLLTTFQNYYHITLVTAKNRIWINRLLFASFFKLLLDNGIDDYEDPFNPIPRGYVQVMTIHQSKGLEFPVVVVGSLDRKGRVIRQIDRDLGPFYHRAAFEPEDKISMFDNMRQYYVAFSRAEKLLVLSACETPLSNFDSVWQGLPQWPYVKRDVLQTLKFKLKKQFVPKRSYSLTTHINVYEVCPRQYQFYEEYEFSPSRSATMTFGTLVHQTVEDIHKKAVEKKFEEISEDRIRNQWFESNYQSLMLAGMRPLSEDRKQAALEHVLNYYRNNRHELARVIETEVDVSVEKPSYILTGKIDLLLGNDGKLEVLDFKSQKRPSPGDPIIDRYNKQLCLYAHILRERYGKNPHRLYIYWTGENERSKALAEYKVDESAIRTAGEHFDKIVEFIKAGHFEVKNAPAPDVCRNCDFRSYCDAEGTIKFKFRHRKHRIRSPR